MAAIAAATAAAATKRTAIEAEAAQTTDAGLGGSDVTATGNDEGAYTLAIKYGETSITVEGATDDDDEKFDVAMDFGDGRTMLTRTHDANMDGDVVVEVAIVSTDIEAPKATAFGMVEMLNANPETDGGDDFQSLNIQTAQLEMLETSGITSTGAGTITLLPAREDDASTTDVDETRMAFSTPAMFRDAPGTLTCGGTGDCTATLDADGDITAVAGGWIFTPDSGATIDVPDADYLNYGFWLQRTTDSGDAVTYNEVETFAGSSVAASGDVGSVLGSATYSGGAVGVYVRETYDSTDGSVDTATSGHFKADANLMATFGQVPVSDTDTTGTIAPNLLNTLSGTINNFELSNGEANDWAVNLQGTITTSDGTVADGTASGGGDEGAFRATFHGDVTADAEGNVPHPGSVVGEFNANFGNGLVAGGFGARRD